MGEADTAEPTGRTAEVELTYTVRVTEFENDDEDDLILGAMEIVEDCRKDPSDTDITFEDE